MRIRTNLFLLSTILVVLIAAIGFMVFQAFGRINRKVAEGRSANKIIRDVSELDLVTYEYTMHQEERMGTQWRQKYNTLGKELKHMKRAELNRQQLRVFDGMFDEHEALNGLFLRLQESLARKEKLIKEDRPRSEMDMARAVEERLVAQLLICSQKIRTGAFRLSAMIQQTIVETRERTERLLLVSIVGFAILASWISFCTFRAITRPLSELVRGTEAIGRGDLQHKIDLRTKNEMGQLADSFNRMTEDLRQAHEALAAEAERLAVTLRSIGDGVIAADTEGHIVLLNEVAENLTGWPQEEAVGRPLAEVFHIINEKTRERCEDPVTKVLESGLVIGLANDTVLVSRDGTERIIADSGAPIRGGDGNVIGVVMVFRDVTERKAMEEQLVRQEKLAVLGQLAGGVSHELRNPLGVMKNSVYFLNIALDDVPEKVKEHLQILDDQVGGANEIITNLLDFSRVRPPTREAAAVRALLDEALGECHIPSSIHVGIDVPGGIGAAVDPTQIHHVLLNLIRNAVQAMPEGGELSVTGRRDKDAVVITVADTGCGIAEHDLGKIFEPLFTTKARGTGLGLSVCKSLAVANQGELSVESEVGRGTSVYLRLPASEKEVSHGE